MFLPLYFNCPVFTPNDYTSMLTVSTHVQGGILDVFFFNSRKLKQVLQIPLLWVTILHFALTFNDHLNLQNILWFQRD